jgi:hypothetical protein
MPFTFTLCRAPCVCSFSLDPYAAMGQLGWKFPTSDSDPDGSPNFYLDSSTPVAFGSLAELTVPTFRRVYHLRHPGQLQYKSFSRDRVDIRFPALRIKRES